ncbi:helix-turn-helix domain-containing protein [Falsiroseomonas sp. CW058]|uniref:helix-turn-helix domain-containing protein n=1 Tax=Falsiroseomonas sp. CW058 TaxID=3388664 RepID=UPI003D322B39
MGASAVEVLESLPAAEREQLAAAGHSPAAMRLGGSLRAARRRAGLGVEALARRLDLPAEELRAIESGVVEAQADETLLIRLFATLNAALPASRMQDRYGHAFSAAESLGHEAGVAETWHGFDAKA